MADIAQFRVDFDTSDAQNSVDALADATTRAMDQMEDASQSSMTASSQDMERLGDIFRQVGGDIDSSIKRMIEQEENLAKQTQETAEEGSSLGTAFSAVGTVLAAAGTAIAATVTAIGALVQTTTSAIVETDNYAQAVGISTEAMQAFQFAAQRVGGDTDALRESLRTSQDAIAQFVNDGTGPAAEALELFGLQLTDSSGKVRSMEQLMPELVTALGNIQDPAERSRLAMQLFGEEDSRVMLALANNPKILQESASALERYGLVMGEDLVQQSRDFQTGVTDLMAALQGLAQELVSALLPTINALLPQFTAWVVSLRESDTVQKELIPTLQAIIGYLGQLGVAVDVLRVGWAALNIAFNAAVMVILEGVGKIAQGLGTVITAAGTAANALGMEGIAESLQSAGAAVTEVGNAADQMGDIARESMQEWQTSLNANIISLNQTTTATQQTTTATKELGQAATQAGQAVTEASKAMADETAKAQAQAKALREAYLDLGIKSSVALKKLADEAVADFKTIQQNGTETPKRLAAIWVEEVVPKIIEAYGKIPPALAQYDRIIQAGAEQTLSSLGQVLENLGIKTEQALFTTADAAKRNLETVVATFGIRSKEAAQAWDATIDDISAGYERLPPNVERIGRLIVEANQKSADASANAHEGGVQRTMDAYGRLSQLTQEIMDDDPYGQVINSGFQYARTLEGLQEQLRKTRTEYDNWSRAVGIPLDVAEFNMKRLNEVINELQSRIRDLSDAEQDAANSANALNSSAQGLNSTLGTLTISATLFGEKVQLVQNRFGEWRPQVEEVNQGLQDVTHNMDQGTQSTNGLGRAMSGAAGAASDTATALGTLTARQIAYNDSLHDYTDTMREGIRTAPLTPPVITQGPPRGSTAPLPGTGGYDEHEEYEEEEYERSEGPGITPGYEESARLRGTRYYSAVLGDQPAQLPVGVPFPSDLGVPQGGISYFPTSPTPGRASSYTQQTIVNVNEPITLQTKADSSTLTSQAVVDGLNEAIRRGILRPELSRTVSAGRKGIVS